MLFNLAITINIEFLEYLIVASRAVLEVWIHLRHIIFDELSQLVLVEIT